MAQTYLFVKFCHRKASTHAFPYRFLQSSACNRLPNSGIECGNPKSNEIKVYCCNKVRTFHEVQMSRGSKCWAVLCSISISSHLIVCFTATVICTQRSDKYLDQQAPAVSFSVIGYCVFTLDSINNPSEIWNHNICFQSFFLQTTKPWHLWTISFHCIAFDQLETWSKDTWYLKRHLFYLDIDWNTHMLKVKTRIRKRLNFLHAT